MKAPRGFVITEGIGEEGQYVLHVRVKRWRAVLMTVKIAWRVLRGGWRAR